MIRGLEHRLMDTNGIRLHVVQSGPPQGHPVILLHGFPEFWYGWRNQIEPLSQEGYRLWIPDQRGYNLSDKPQGLGAYHMDQMVADVLGLIEATEHPRVTLIGHDWGGAIAWRLAERYPQKIDRLVILNVPHGSVFVKNLRKNPRQMLRSWYMFCFRLPWIPEYAAQMGDFEMLARALRKTSRSGSFTDDDLDFYRRAWSQPGSVTAMLNWYRALFKARPKQPFGIRIRPPTLLIWGAKDSALGREMAQPSIERCENGRLEFLEHCTHWVQHDDPQRVNSLILEFLKMPLEES